MSQWATILFESLSLTTRNNSKSMFSQTKWMGSHMTTDPSAHRLKMEVLGWVFPYPISQDSSLLLFRYPAHRERVIFHEQRSAVRSHFEPNMPGSISSAQRPEAKAPFKPNIPGPMSCVHKLTIRSHFEPNLSGPMTLTHSQRSHMRTALKKAQGALNQRVVSKEREAVRLNDTFMEKIWTGFANSEPIMASEEVRHHMGDGLHEICPCKMIRTTK
ncbi:hypothetical protein AMTR_s00012p00178070 [Amborella trichopoda]|uniref:Uncharacterized protein n=1 Tax=Amborella trichopoda TaxID=13333 RepID=W1PD29_AMBTC|nr:hypothetical protein AMTR_s00012p00178070 [Amborella trichopoda]